ncbi:rCG63050 [Rattus norvegicus]|uniref:RCG63050 n=1 Tax=Rattus norvegicus TaxID=10116 RepID=A6JMV1_RAT|nr:rCG63050 [Rattus norvegicus]
MGELPQRNEQVRRPYCLAAVTPGRTGPAVPPLGLNVELDLPGCSTWVHGPCLLHLGSARELGLIVGAW